MDQFSPDSGSFAADEASAQRDGGRDSLLLSAQMSLPGLAAPIAVRVRNLSSGGLMAEYAGRAAIGDPVQIEVRGVGQVRGKIAWATAGRIGVAFESEIDPMLARKPVAAPQRQTAPLKRGVL